MNWRHLSSANGDLPVPPASAGQSGLKVLDVDKNGQNDYIITLWGSPGIVWYRHVGNQFEKYIIEPDQMGLSHGETFKDIDGDGDIDLILGDAGLGTQLYWWENPYPNYDPNTRWVRRLVRGAGSPGFYHDNIWGDFDGDGVEEFMSWYQYGQQLLFFEVPANPKTSGQWPVSTVFSWSGESLKYRGTDRSDINLDGKIDFVGGGGWFEHQGGSSFAYRPIDETMAYSQIKAGQLIAGGRPEVVCVLELDDGPLNMYSWIGSAWQKFTLVTNLAESHTLQLGDINQDGHLDIVVGELAQVGAIPETPGARLLALYGDSAGNFNQQAV
ncbi:MAG TPA: hypothetical protein VK633_08500, partial [Verrucomicrobiae bacterium]|nr:hypothetical protein [Verrucomicrobiae bacterium]